MSFAVRGFCRRSWRVLNIRIRLPAQSEPLHAARRARDFARAVEIAASRQNINRVPLEPGQSQRTARAPRDVTRNEAHRLNPVGFSVKGHVADVTILSQKLCASGRKVPGREGSRRPARESDFGVGRIDRSHRRAGKEDQQVGWMTGPVMAARGA